MEDLESADIQALALVREQLRASVRKETYAKLESIAERMKDEKQPLEPLLIETIQLLVDMIKVL